MSGTEEWSETTSVHHEEAVVTHAMQEGGTVVIFVVQTVCLFLICAQMWLWNNFVFASPHPGHTVALFEVGAQFLFVQQADVTGER